MKTIRLRAAPDFDIAEWHALYRCHPEAAEARRQSLIVIELARAAARSGPAARLADALTAAADPALPATRLTLAAHALDESAREMNQAFAALHEQLRRIAGGRCPDGP